MCPEVWTNKSIFSYYLNLKGLAEPEAPGPAYLTLGRRASISKFLSTVSLHLAERKYSFYDQRKLVFISHTHTHIHTTLTRIENHCGEEAVILEARH